jgi:hypothetical protein
MLGDNMMMAMSLFPWLPASRLMLLVLWIWMSLLHVVGFDDAGDVLNWCYRQRR